MSTLHALLGAIEYLDLAHGQDNEDVNAIVAHLTRIVNADLGQRIDAMLEESQS